MRTQKIMPKNTAERGFTLVELTIVIIIISFLMAAFFAGLRIYWTERQDFIERSRNEAIRSAIVSFIQEPRKCEAGEVPRSAANPNGEVCMVGGMVTPEVARADPARFPCPASLTAVPGDADFGVELCPADANGNGRLDPADLAYGDADNDGVFVIRGRGAVPNVLIGTIPTATLGIPADNMKDLYENRVFYAVTLDYVESNDVLTRVNNPTARIPILRQGMTFENARDAEINNADADPNNDVPFNSFVIYSAGSDGAGAYAFINGQQTAPCRDFIGAGDMGDASHCFWQNNIDNDNPGPAAMFIDGETIGDVMNRNSDNYYDDRLITTLTGANEDQTDRWWRSVDNTWEDDTSIINVNLRTVQVADAPFNDVNEDQEKLLVGGGVRIDNGNDWADNQTLVQVGALGNPGSLFLTQNNAGISGNLRFSDPDDPNNPNNNNGGFFYEGTGFGSAIFFNNTSLDGNDATLPNGDINVFMAPSGAAGVGAVVTSVLRITNPTPTAANPTPHMGDVEIGENPETDTLDTNDFTNPTHLGSSLVFLGAKDPAPFDVCGNPRDYRGDNSDPLFMQRFNVLHDRSQLRISFGDYNPQWEFPTGGADGNNPTGDWVRDCGAGTQIVNFMDSIEIGGLVGGTGSASDGEFRSAFAVNGLGNANVAGDMRIGNSNSQCTTQHFGAMRFNQNTDNNPANTLIDNDLGDDRMEYCAPISAGYRAYLARMHMPTADIDAIQGAWRALGTGVLNYEQTYMPCEANYGVTNTFGNTCATLIFDQEDIYVGRVDSDIKAPDKPHNLGDRARVYNYRQAHRDPDGTDTTNNGWWGSYTSGSGAIGSYYVAKNDAMLVVKASIPVDLAQRRAFRVDNYTVSTDDSKVNQYGNVANDSNQGYQQPIIGDGSFNPNDYGDTEKRALEGIQLMPPRNLEDINNDTRYGNAIDDPNDGDYDIKEAPEYTNNLPYKAQQRSVWESAIQAAIYYRDIDCIEDKYSDIEGPWVCQGGNSPLQLVAMGDLINPVMLHRNGGQGGTGVLTGSFPVKAGARYDIQIYIFTIWPQFWSPDHDTGTAGTLKYQDHNADGVVELMEISPDNYGF